MSRNPTAINDVEWRDLERMLAEAFSGLGFKVELTPPAQDGGKDIVLRHFSVTGQTRTYYVEVKHWATRIGKNIVRDFLRVVVEDEADRGLILATTGFTATAFEELTEVERHRVRVGAKEKTRMIFQKYQRTRSGLYIPSTTLPNVLFDETLPSRGN